MTDTPPPRVSAPGKRISIALAVVVHLILAALLIYGIHWQTKVQDVVEVELVRSAPPPAPKEEPAPQPKPEPKSEPKPLPKPEPKPTPPVKPDIALKDKPKPPPKEEPKPKPEPTPKFDPFQQQMAEEEKRLATHKQIAEEERRLKQQQEAQAASQAASARSKALAGYTDRIRAKIRGNIVLPPELKGNPSALFDVVQLPSGEVISAKLVKGSGHAGYDAAVERAILKSSPLPRPEDATLFERNLRLIFCPQEDGKCG